MSGFSVFPVEGIPELHEGDDLAALILERVSLEENDVVVASARVHVVKLVDHGDAGEVAGFLSRLLDRVGAHKRRSREHLVVELA